MTSLLIILLLTFSVGCGADECDPAHEGNTKQDNNLLYDLAVIFEEAGYGTPCCPTRIFHDGDPRVAKSRKKDFCGMLLGDRSEILIDNSTRMRSRCPDIEDTIFEEWLHYIDYEHGPDLDQAKAKLMIMYWETWLEVND